MTKIYQKTYPAGRNAGFTLIELLVVVLIIGILAAVGLPKYELAVEKSRAAEPLAVLRSLQNAQEVYYMSNGSYATDVSQLDVKVPQSKNFNYSWSGISMAAYSKKKPYLLAYRSAENMAAGGASIVCGTNSPSGSSNFEYARKICSALGAKTDTTGSTYTRWTIVK